MQIQMNEFKTGPDFAAMSIGNSGSALSPWSSQGWFLTSLFLCPVSMVFLFSILYGVRH